MTTLVDEDGCCPAVKAPCRAATTSAITLSSEQTVDGIVLAAGDRVLVKDQAGGVSNGIWIVSTGAWSRAADFSTTESAVSGTRIFVTAGVTNGRREFGLTTADPIIIGTTALTFVDLTRTGGSLPPQFVASSYLRANAGGTAYEFRSPAQITGDITFLQSGSGGVARAVQDKLRDWGAVIDFSGNTFAAALNGTGKQKPFITNDDGGAYWPGALIIDTNRQMTTAQRGRAPLFVWSNPAPSDLVAGHNAGAQIWVGDNPTATPGVGDAVGLTTACVNGNNRTNVWGQNIVVGRSDIGSGYIDGNCVGLEINMYNEFPLTETNPFGPTSGRKNMLEIVGSGGGERLTSAGMIWVNDATGNSWFEHGLAFSRVVQSGIKFVKNPNVTADGIPAFQTAAIYDASDSANVLKVDGTHGSVIDLSGNPTLTRFVKGPANAAMVLNIGNGANQPVIVRLDSGQNAVHDAVLDFADRGAVKWRWIKNNGNGLFLVADPLGTPVNVAEWAPGGGGALGIGGVSPSFNLHVNGTIAFRPGSSVTPLANGEVVVQATSNTSLTFKLKGSDGIVRSGTITLA